MLAAAVLALSLSQGLPAPSARLDRLARAESAPANPQAVSVLLDCQVAARALTDCKAVNEVADAQVVAEAIRLAAAVAVPDALADSGARIRIRMNVAP